MVKQQKPSKTSSAYQWRDEKRYEITTSIKYGALLPRNTELCISGDDLAGGTVEYGGLRFVEVEDYYAIAGTVGDEHANPSHWRELPHEAFANLRLHDMNAVAAFIKTRGVLWGIVVDGYTNLDLVKGVFAEEQLFPKGREPEWSDRDSPARFLEGSARLFEYQGLIRKAWAGDSAAAKEIERIAARDLEIHSSVDTRGVTLVAKKLGGLIFVLFLRDYAAGKCGVCSNRDCPARYFLKSRKTQKFCESGPCVTYARRQYALKYWHDKGAKKRAKKQTKVQRRTKR